jgi:hypothetical protein
MRENLRQILKEYSLEDIFNCDETGLFWKMKPCQTISNEQTSGKKQSKDRVMILLTCNATGSEKLTPLFIHKYENPRLSRILIKERFRLNTIGTKKVGCRFQFGTIT